MSPSTASKASRLLRECRVTPEPGATVYRIAGDTGRYTVVIGPGAGADFASCSCPASGECSHLVAARLLDGALRDEAAFDLAEPREHAARRAAA